MDFRNRLLGRVVVRYQMEIGIVDCGRFASFISVTGFDGVRFYRFQRVARVKATLSKRS